MNSDKIAILSLTSKNRSNRR